MINNGSPMQLSIKFLSSLTLCSSYKLVSVLYKYNVFLLCYDQGYIRISWDGWSDSPAGIEKYEVEVFKLVAVGDNLEQQAVLENLQDLESDQRETSVALTAPG